MGHKASTWLHSDSQTSHCWQYWRGLPASPIRLDHVSSSSFMQERKTKEFTPDRSQNKGRPVSAPDWHSFGSHLLSTVELFLNPQPSSTAPEWHHVNHHITGALLSLLGHKTMSGPMVGIEASEIHCCLIDPRYNGIRITTTFIHQTCIKTSKSL